MFNNPLNLKYNPHEVFHKEQYIMNRPSVVCYTPEDIIHSLRDYNIKYIKDASTKQANDLLNDWESLCELTANKANPAQINTCSMMIKLFKDFGGVSHWGLDWNKSIFYTDIDIVYFKNQVRYIDKKDNSDITHYIRSVYNSYKWNWQFKNNKFTRWNIPISVWYQNNFVNVHPGNTRMAFLDFNDIPTDIIIISNNDIPDLSNSGFNCIDPLSGIEKSFYDNHYKDGVELYTFPEYAEIRFNPSTDTHKDETKFGFWFGHHDTLRKILKYQDKDNFSTKDRMCISMRNGILSFNEEEVAYLEDKCLKFILQKPKFSTKL